MFRSLHSDAAWPRSLTGRRRYSPSSAISSTVVEYSVVFGSRKASTPRRLAAKRSSSLLASRDAASVDGRERRCFDSPFNQARSRSVNPTGQPRWSRSDHPPGYPPSGGSRPVRPAVPAVVPRVGPHVVPSARPGLILDQFHQDPVGALGMHEGDRVSAAARAWRLVDQADLL